MGTSPYGLVRQLGAQLGGVLADIDEGMLDATPARIVDSLKRQIVDVRLDVRDYELAETRLEQQANQRGALERLEGLRKDILVASEYNIFSAVDVAQLTAYIDRITESLE